MICFAIMFVVSKILILLHPDKISRRKVLSLAIRLQSILCKLHSNIHCKFPPKIIKFFYVIFFPKAFILFFCSVILSFPSMAVAVIDLLHSPNEGE